MHQAMKAADPTRGLRKCRQEKERLRHLLKLASTDPDWAQVWRRLTDFQMFAANNIHVPQIRRLAPHGRRLAVLHHRRDLHRYQQRKGRRLQPHRQARRTGPRSGSATRPTTNAGYDKPTPAHHAGRQLGSGPAKREDPP